MIEAKHTAMEVRAARVLCKRNAETCGVDEGDSWRLYGSEWLIDAREALNAAAVPDLLEALRGLLPQTFTGNPTQAQLTAHWERERELGNEQAQFVLAAYAAIAKATGEPL